MARRGCCDIKIEEVQYLVARDAGDVGRMQKDRKDGGMEECPCQDVASRPFFFVTQKRCSLFLLSRKQRREEVSMANPARSFGRVPDEAKCVDFSPASLAPFPFGAGRSPDIHAHVIRL